MSPTIKLNTQNAVLESLEKKLSKKYPFLKKGYKEKGTLIIGIIDPLFGGFINDIEIKFKSFDLNSLEEEAIRLSKKSCFDKVLIVDGLREFYLNPQQDAYQLLPLKNNNY
ncbi:MAG: hypothetical protein COT84_08015 [Chlamydiae bacterium CG10_big_fil_rev_8_21_14_0_10_35_9]|nr:MAG: hypothetical protein COT84_08015 [Chlamydiae bacterium CG10_big_fil_rev_8_21_14_0_10_35_9]